MESRVARWACSLLLRGQEGGFAVELRRSARHVRARLRVASAVLAEEHAVLRAHADQVKAVSPGGEVRGPRLVWAGRIALASVVVGVLAWALGLGHGYWATVSAAAVL